MSPILFTIYLDRLLFELKKKGVGCYWGHHFAGALEYADDVVLFAPSASALRLMLRACVDFASSNGLYVKPSKTQLIRFILFKSHPCGSSFIFCNQALPLFCSVIDLGDKLMYNLYDDSDIRLTCCQMVRADNLLFFILGDIDPWIVTFLFKSYCLSLFVAQEAILSKGLTLE